MERSSIGISLSTSEVSDVRCPRKNILITLGKMKGVVSGFEENAYTLAGNIVHDIIAETVKPKGKAILEYHIKREKKSLYNALLATFKILSAEWEELLQFHELERPVIQDALRIVDQQRRNTVELLEKLLSESAANAEFVSNEVIVAQIFPDEGFLLSGRIDLVSFDGKELALYEIKTGKPKPDDRVQLQIYGAITEKQIDLPIRLALIYTKSKHEGIKEIRAKPALLNILKDTVRKARNVHYKEDVPEPVWKKKCQYCQWCDLEEEIFTN